MKTNIITFFFIALVATGLTFCGEEDQTKKEPLLTIETSPTAKPEDDAKSSGVYKGTFVGSSGSFKLIVEAGQVIGYLEVDGVEYILTTEDITPEDLGSAITNALFTDASGKVQLLFSVEADGKNPTVSLTIEGHEDVHVVVFKETSNTLLKIFEGFQYKTYPDKGVQVKAHLNIILNHDSVARVTFKSVEEFPLNNGVTGTHGAESWANDAYYWVGGDYYTTNILVYRYFPDPNNPTGPSLLEWFFAGLPMNYSDEEIHSKRQWAEGNFTYSDSTRLKRKL